MSGRHHLQLLQVEISRDESVSSAAGKSQSTRSERGCDFLSRYLLFSYLSTRALVLPVPLILLNCKNKNSNLHSF